MVHNNQTQTWIEEAQHGDSAAISKLLAAHHPTLRARANASMGPQLRAHSEPEDILQQVYIQIFRSINRFENRGPDSFVNWVLTILDNKITDAQRALHRQIRDINREVQPAHDAGTSESYWNLLDQMNVNSLTPSRVVRREEAVGALLAAMSHLSESHRTVIQMRFIESRPVSEVAEHLGKSEPAVVALTKRALEALKKAMDGLGEFTRGP